MRTLLCLFLCGQMTTALAAQPRSDSPSSSHPVVLQAFLEPVEDRELAFPVLGRVEHVFAKPGQRVERGTLLLQLNDDELDAQIRLLQIRAASDLEIQSARAELDLSRLEFQIISNAEKGGAANMLEIERARLNMLREELALQLFEQRQIETSLQLEQARAQLRQLSIKSPISGIVTEVSIDEGEVVSSDSSVAVRVIDESQLVCKVAAPAYVASSILEGDKAWIRIGENVLTGSVRRIATEVDRASQTRTIDIIVPNSESLPSGLLADVMLSEPADR